MRRLKVYARLYSFILFPIQFLLVVHLQAKFHQFSESQRSQSSQLAYTLEAGSPSSTSHQRPQRVWRTCERELSRWTRMAHQWFDDLIWSKYVWCCPKRFTFVFNRTVLGNWWQLLLIQRRPVYSTVHLDVLMFFRVLSMLSPNISFDFRFL